jgi:hypothetical protein
VENAERDILEERTVAADQGILTSKRYATTATGTVLKETRVAFCDFCGTRLDDEHRTIVCCEDRKKLCESCAIRYLGKFYCEDCLQRLLPLTRLQFKTLYGLIQELDLGSIRELARSSRQEFDSALNQLRVNGYVEKKGVSLFSVIVVTDLGILAWKTYEAVFIHGDVSHFMEEVQNHLMEVEHSGIERNNRERH